MTREATEEILKNQEVLRGRVFEPTMAEFLGIKELIDWVKFQNWEHLFEGPVPHLHE